MTALIESRAVEDGLTQKSHFRRIIAVVIHVVDNIRECSEGLEFTENPVFSSRFYNQAIFFWYSLQC